MFKRLLSLTLMGFLLNAANAVTISAFAQAGQVGPTAGKVKADVARRVGKKSRVTVKLQDGSKLKGHITQAGEDSFTLTDSKTGQTRTLAYGDVSEVKGQGGLPLVAKIGIGLGIAVGVLAILFVVGKGRTSGGPVIGGL